MSDWKINGVDLILDPTAHRWIDPEPVGKTGDGHPIYPAVKQYEMRWDVSYTSGTSQLITFFNTVALTGTASVTLPKYADPTYTFYTYTGCTLYSPTRGEFFAEHPTNVTLIVDNIRV